MTGLYRDLKFGIRMLCKTPGFTIIAVLTIGLGIGANTTIFSIFNAFILRPLPYENADRLVSIREHGDTFGYMSTSYPNYLDWREQNQTFEDIGLISNSESNLTGAGIPQRVRETWVSASLFHILGVQPTLGRLFNDEEEQPGERSVILSHQFWLSHFGGDENIIGKTITLNFIPNTVIGVMPAGFNFPPYSDDRSDMWSLIGFRKDQDWLMQRGNHPGIQTVGLLKPGVSIEQAQEDLTRIAASLEKQYPNDNTGLSAHVIDYKKRLNEDIEPMLFALIQCVLFVLLIACANIANLLLARSTARQQEIAVRTAMGVGRYGLIRQFICESMILSLLGAGAGVMFAFWGLSGVLYMMPHDLAQTFESLITIDMTVLIYTLLLTVITAFFFGIIPALQSFKINLNDVLKDAGRSASGGKRRINFRNMITGIQIALALVLLVGSGLTVRSLIEVLRADLGYDPNNVLLMEMSLTNEKYDTDESKHNFYQTLISQLESIPGVEHATLAQPLLGGWQSTYQVEGEPIKPPGQNDSAEFKEITPEYKDTLEISLLQGRFFNESDNKDSVKVAVVDDKFVRMHWQNDDPIGKRIRIGSGENNENDWLNVIGVVKHIKYYGIEEEARQEVILPMYQSSSNSFTVAMRTGVDPVSIIKNARNSVFDIDKDLPVSNVRTLEDVVIMQTLIKTFLTTFLCVFAGIALFLSSIGIYGVMSYSVSQRYHEFGIRMALGASMTNVIKMVVQQGFRLVITGLVFGLLLSIWVAYLLSTQLYNVSIYDPTTYIAVSLILFAVALLACFIPAWRASCVNPMNALRYE